MVAPGAASWRRLHLRARRVGAGDLISCQPILVLAPHPDDESLGVGALLATRALAGNIDHVAFLTDGAGSHLDVPGWSAARIGRARANEGRQAVAALGIRSAPLFLEWEDAAPPRRAAPLFRQTAARLAAFCRRNRIRAIVSTWSGEPHCDHEAAAMLAQVVARACRIPQLDYLVWGWTLANLEEKIAGRCLLSFDVSRGRTRQRRAIGCHRSQFGGRISGGGTRFRLPPTMLGLAARPTLILLSGKDHNAT